MNIQDKTYIKINYNPYRKQITYFIFGDSEEWEDMGAQDDQFRTPTYSHNTFQNIMYDVVKYIYDNYNPGNVGIHITFEGTKEDGEEFGQFLTSYYPPSKYTIEYESETVYLSADEVKQRIEKIFTSCVKLFKQYNNDEINKLLSKYNQTIKPTIPLCFMGLYSSGKSAFINSILGKEILPSGKKPTTAKIYKITNSEQYSIKCYFISDENDTISIRIIIHDDKHTIKCQHTCPFRDAFKELSNPDYDSVEKKMRKALEIINQLQIENLIEITLPINNDAMMFDKYNYVIFDTPGSNSEAHEEHLTVLKEAMASQTNGLPIFVTHPLQTDAGDNNNIIADIQAMGDQLDSSNLLVLITHADQDSVDGEVAQDEKIRDLSPAAILFVSSVIGLGTKKALEGQCLIDRSYLKSYNNAIDMFSDENDEFYSESQVFLYNHAPIQFLDQYKRKFKDFDQSKIAYKNSGLHCIEFYIQQFAQKYADYNKCSQACSFLSEAITMLSDLIKEEQDKLESEEKKFREQLGDKKTVLLNKIKAKIEELTGCELSTRKKKDKIDEKKTFAYDFEIMAQKAVYIPGELGDTIKNRIDEIWEQAMQEAKYLKKKRMYQYPNDRWKRIKIRVGYSVRSEAKRIASPRIAEYINNIGADWQKTLNQNTSEFCPKWDISLKSDCLKIIFESDTLDDEQKNKLKKKMEAIDLVKPEDFQIEFQPDEIFSSVLGIHFISGKAPDRCRDALVDKIRDARRSYVNSANSNFIDFANAIMVEIRTGIADMNPVCVEINNRIIQCVKNIELFGDWIDMIEGHIRIIKTDLMGGDSYAK